MRIRQTMRRTPKLPFALAALLAPSLLAFSGCKSNHIEFVVENRTGSPIQILEVDYPSASFGADALAAGADFRYSVKVLGDGPVKVAYTEANGKQAQMSGPTLNEQEQGQLEIVLLPAAKAQFTPHLTQSR